MTGEGYITENFLAGEDALPNSTFTLTDGVTSAITPSTFAEPSLQGQVLTECEAGVDITAGQLVSLNKFNVWVVADADDDSSINLLGIALKTTTDGNTMDVLIDGVIALDDSFLTVGDLGKPLYISTTAGDITGTAPSARGDYVRIIGHYIKDDSTGSGYIITFKPDGIWVLL
jgi:hypothetical protein